MRDILDKALLRGQLREIDLHAALFLQKLAGKPSPELLLAAALASRAVGEGHICLPLDSVAGETLFSPDAQSRAPEIAAWRRQLMESGVVGLPGETMPLILDSADRLYIARYNRYERVIAEDLLLRNRGVLPVDTELAATVIARLFPDSSGEDWQKMAVSVAALKKFVVITGGPGTGKTFTVARILALLQSLSENGLRIELVAPTGKAAVRLQESIMAAKSSLDDDLAAKVPVATKTLHRLLGFMPGSSTFRYNKTNKLHLDLLVIDEASMIDVPLMARLIEALPEKTRIILLGDRDQLTSVEAGSLFGDICHVRETRWSSELSEKVHQLAGWVPDPVSAGNMFADSIVQLQESYRFQNKKRIASLANAVNNGNWELVESMYENKNRYEDLVFEQPEDSDAQSLEKHLLEGFKQCFASHEPAEALHALTGFRILCCVREGTKGIAGVNSLAEKLLRRHGFIRTSDKWYQGCPLIIRRNHYGLQLFNGDTGVVWPDKKGHLWAWFSRPDGSLHQVPLSRLPEHDTAYGITVHQSQGSEFKTVLFLLPGVETRVLCRELIYTAITRARERLLVIGEPHFFKLGLERNVIRYSGLVEKLWNEEECC